MTAHFGRKLSENNLLQIVQPVHYKWLRTLSMSLHLLMLQRVRRDIPMMPLTLKKETFFFFSFCRTVLSCWASFLLFISVCVYFEEVSWDNVQTQSNHVKTWTGSCHNTSSNSVVASDGNKLESTYWQRHRELCDLIPLQPYHPPHSPPDQTGSGFQAIMNHTAFVVPGMFFYGLEGCILSLNC